MSSSIRSSSTAFSSTGRRRTGRSRFLPERLRSRLRSSRSSVEVGGAFGAAFVAGAASIPVVDTTMFGGKPGGGLITGGVTGAESLIALISAADGVSGTPGGSTAASCPD